MEESASELPHSSVSACLPHRQTAVERLDSVFADLNRQASDTDIIVLGDLNTMGAQGRVDAKGEIQLLEQVASRETPEYRHPKLTPGCTE